MTAREINRALRGRKVVNVRLNPFTGFDGRKATAPVIYFDDGTRLYFTTQETGSEYGTQLGIARDIGRPPAGV